MALSNQFSDFVSRMGFPRRSSQPRADAAIGFSVGFAGLGMLLLMAHDLTSPRSLVGVWSLPIAATAGSFMAASLAVLAMKQAGNWSAWPRLILVALMLAQAAWWYEWQAPTPLEPADVHAFLAAGPTADDSPGWDGKGVLEWDDDVPAWCIALAGEPDDAQRAARVAALGAVLRPWFEAGAFIPHETQAAAADAGALSTDVARALLTSPRGLEEGEDALSPEEAARIWLRALPRENPGDGHQYALARAVQVVTPDLDGLAAGVGAALPGGLSEPGTGGAVSELRNALALAESLGLEASVASLRERIAPTLREAWVKDRALSRDDAGFDRFPEKGSRGVPDALETHAAIELMARYGVPDGIDLDMLAVALDVRSADARFNTEAERVVATMDSALMQAIWPDSGRRSFQVSDALFLALVALIAWAIRNIQRQPLTMPDVAD